MASEDKENRPCVAIATVWKFFVGEKARAVDGFGDFAQSKQAY